MILDWPTRKGSKPITTALNQAIYKAAAASLRDEQPEATDAFVQALEASSTRWRRDYITVVEKFVRLQAAASPQALLQSCRAGLDFATQSFVFRDTNNPDTTVSIADAFAANVSTAPILETVTINGSIRIPASADIPFPLASPHGTDTDPIWITGDDAVAQIHTWRDYGCMEPSAADHAIATCTTPNATTLVRGQTFVLLGITSEMGPARHLLQFPGTHVLGVARSGPKLQALQKWFRIHGSVDATLQCAAANLLTDDVIAVAQWILNTAPKDKPLVLLPLAYMDGEANVRVTVAMDTIVTHMLQHHPSTVSLVYLTSPTTIYTIPKEAALDAQGRYLAQDWKNQMLSVVSLGQWLQPANTWKQIDESDAPIVFNGAYNLQGPNYLLAKLMQQWRCMVAAADGVPVHAPHAPGTRTDSVRHNPQAAVALEGLQYIPPLLTFDVGPCSSLMTAIMLHQLAASRDTTTAKPAPRHPMELFWDGAVHGGGWRCPYTSESIVAWTFLLGKTWAEPGWCPPAALAPILSSTQTSRNTE